MLDIKTTSSLRPLLGSLTSVNSGILLYFTLWDQSISSFRVNLVFSLILWDETFQNVDVKYHMATIKHLPIPHHSTDCLEKCH